MSFTRMRLGTAWLCRERSQPWTCFTDRTWILDYVFFSSQTLQAMGVLQVVDKDVIQQTGGLPSKSFPSDHLPLKANLALTM
ncbi:hypothetical protein BaRGS_00032458 [Batillaria attramentaria]|uniref:Endonuclease/exonuclease/phosphatase domain-containing protein n=1 Tax=Batillaria attramentaria TaxID=370345 RepID=A0ABD0JNP0_9CAEN